MKKTIAVLLSITISIVCNAQINQQQKYIDPQNMDTTVTAGDDFYQYANGGWLKNNAIPPSKVRWGSFDVLGENASKALKTIAENAAANTKKGRIYQMVGDLYTSGMDSLNAEKLMFNPIKNDLARIASIKTMSEVITEIATLRTKGIASPLFDFGVGQDDKKTSQYISSLDQGGTVLPNRDYYLKTDSRSISIQKEFKLYIADLFKLINTDSVTATQNSDAIFGLETALAKVQLSKVELRDPIKTYNKINVDDFSKNLSNIHVRDLMKAMFVVNQDSILTNNPAFIKCADSLLNTLPLSTWKAYLQWYILKSSAAYLSNDFVDRNFQFYKFLSGQKIITPRWQRMSYLIDKNLGDLMGQLYVEKHFTLAAKKRMLALVNNLQIAFKERIGKLDWMSAATKEKAIFKLNTITKKIGYPDKWKTYDGVVITKDNLLQNIQNCNAWKYKNNIQKLGKPIDKTEWYMTPPTINAYYSAPNNEIVFPAAILQFPFFDFKADDAVNYGAIGAVIGHEMTHGFDDQGRQYGADGNLNDWWTKTDAEKFKAKTKKLVQQFNALTIQDSIHINGELTLGENIADLGGVSIAYQAFKKTAQGKSLTKINGLTPDQRFFLSFAQIWRSKILPQAAAQNIITDPHSPTKHRCNATLSNIDAFYQIFKIEPSNKMYKTPQDRIKIW